MPAFEVSFRVTAIVDAENARDAELNTLNESELHVHLTSTMRRGAVERGLALNAAGHPQFTVEYLGVRSA